MGAAALALIVANTPMSGAYFDDYMPMSAVCRSKLNRRQVQRDGSSFPSGQPSTIDLDTDNRAA